MKKIIYILSCFLLLLNTNAFAKKIKIAFCIDDLRQERWEKERVAFLKAAKEAGAIAYTSSADAQVTKQISQIENFISRGVDAIVIVPYDGKALTQVVKQATREGIKVISYDHFIQNVKYDAFITYDNLQTGIMQASELVKVKPKGNYFLLGGSPTDNNSYLFRKGQLQVLKPYIDRGDIKIVGKQYTKGWMPSVALKIIENALTINHNKIDAIVASNDGTAGAAIQAVKAQGLKGVAISGQDGDLIALKSILKGEQTMTVLKPTKPLTQKAVKLAIDLVKGNKVKYNYQSKNGVTKIPTIFVPAYAITKDNIELVVKEGMYTKKQLGIK